MDVIKPFKSQDLEAICKFLADTSKGVTGGQISRLLQEIKVADISPQETKWVRLFNALAQEQNKRQVGNHAIMIITRVMKPVNFINDRERFEWLRSNLNIALAFSGLEVRENGSVARTVTETTLSGAAQRAGRLRAVLLDRNVHDEVLKYCRAELLEENYFHAVLEATKGIAQRIRDKSMLTTDGSELVTAAFSTRSPILKINPLSNETEVSEQKGFTNLLIGLFGAVRNPTAHAPKVSWPIPEQDALDILVFISFLHRKLDRTVHAHA
jgi:uncharacterized protein (TIGR02391 family)